MSPNFLEAIKKAEDATDVDETTCWATLACAYGIRDLCEKLDNWRKV